MNQRPTLHKIHAGRQSPPRKATDPNVDFVSDWARAGSDVYVGAGPSFLLNSMCKTGDWNQSICRQILSLRVSENPSHAFNATEICFLVFFLFYDPKFVLVFLLKRLPSKHICFSDMWKLTGSAALRRRPRQSEGATGLAVNHRNTTEGRVQIPHCGQ